MASSLISGSAASLKTINLAAVPILTGGSNYRKWRREIELLLTLNEYDIALDMPQPAALNDKSTKSEKVEFERWTRANKVALSILESGMTDTVRGGIKKCDLAKDYLTAIENKFKESQKAEIAQYMTLLTTYKFEGGGSIRDHIMKMTDAAEKLNSLDMNICEKQLVFMILQALPLKFSQLKVSYNTQDKTWTVDELIAQCVQEENRQKHDKGKEVDIVNFVQTSKGKKEFNANFGSANAGKTSKSNYSDKSALSAKISNSSKSNNFKKKAKNIEKIRCHHCKTKGHYRKDCEIFKEWLRAKGRTDIYVCEESNLIEIPANSWWFDTGASVHITNSLQGFKQQKQSNSYNVFVGEGTKVLVEAVGIVQLKFETGFVLQLENVLYVPLMRRSLLSASKLVQQGIVFIGDVECTKFFKRGSLVGKAFLHDNLWKLQCSIVNNSMHVLNTTTKRMHIDDTYMLWHKRLGHISKERVLQLSKLNFIPVIDFKTASDCIDCMKGKTTNVRKLDAKRSQALLELIHTDVCGPFSVKTICGNSYFVSFIDDFSRHSHIFLIKEKSAVLECFKIFKNEVEKQLNLVIKIVRSDRGGEYFGRYTEAGQQKGPFAYYLEQQGIVAQYTTPGTPQQNGVAERRNRTLMGMVRSLISRSKLPGFLWGEALKTANYILNRVDSSFSMDYNYVSVLPRPSASITDLDTEMHGTETAEVAAQDQLLDPSIHISPTLVDSSIVQSTDQLAGQQPLRKSTRILKPAISADFVYLQDSEFDIGDIDDPVTYQQAVQSSQVTLWQKAMEEELESMAKNNVWTLVNPSSNIKPIGCKWVYKTKRDAAGRVERYKARLVAKGFNQREGVDYNDTFSPVSSKDSMRVIMALTSHFDMELHQMDVKTAFLNGDLQEDIHMIQPLGFVERGKEKMVCKLNKSIYGLKQASRQWFLKFDQVITSHGFTENKMDDCIYLKFKGSNFIFLILYVDDILLASSDLQLLVETKKLLSTNFEMKDLGEAHYVLGIEIVRDRQKKLLGLSQKGYIERVLSRFNMESCNKADVPVNKGDKFSRNQCPKSEHEIEVMRMRPYASLVGSLMYANICTRPDLAFIVGLLGRFQSNPGETHWIAAKKVLRYLQRTKEFMLMYGREDCLEIVGYTDSDLAGDLDERKSTGGYIFMMKGGAVSWKSAKQTIVSTSTMEAEFVACFEGMKQAVWLRNFVAEMKIVDSVKRPLRMFCDNSAAVFFSKNNKRTSASRLMDVKFLKVREMVKKGEIEIQFLSTNLMIADPLTKALPNNVFKGHVVRMGVLESFDKWE
ncbi:hypothetical protein PS2_043635 [Malus domestica]